MARVWVAAAIFLAMGAVTLSNLPGSAELVSAEAAAPAVQVYSNAN